MWHVEYIYTVCVSKKSCMQSEHVKKSQWSTLPETAVHYWIEMSACIVTVHSTPKENLLKLLIVL